MALIAPALAVTGSSFPSSTRKTSVPKEEEGVNKGLSPPPTTTNFSGESAESHTSPPPPPSC
eukprot:CAMPEP_0171913776 /NCGR_PEP_ID=MMETSP0993-20121228/11996_1 /TAXON_ID=483369 /ORGANISM="non described non described, Strain CCMP2098" /LENGTH=61 /DNA_ID=CAMNT_0012547863 /DNA_START=17 /DNA_END=202 /DNA_ORIENTATION=+